MEDKKKFEDQYIDCEDNDFLEEDRYCPENNECGEVKIYTKCVHIHVNCKGCKVLKNR